MCFIWYSNEYSTRKTRLDRLAKDIQNEQLRQLDALDANLRRKYYYRKKSLPYRQVRGNGRLVDDERFSEEYRDWLFDMVDESGLRIPTISAPSKSIVRLNEGGIVSDIANTYRYEIKTGGTLDQLIDFCFEFEQLDLLHNIATLSITPLKKNETLTGNHNISMKVDVIALKDADEDRDFLMSKRPLDTELADYKNPILTRNIFGPANNPPSISLSRKSYDEDEDISFTLNGRDPDKSDTLTYELLDDGGIDGIEIEPKDERRATLTCPPLSAGEYVVKIQVQDSGFPRKTDEDELKLVIKKKKPPEEKIAGPPPKPPEPKFEYASKTSIKRISYRRSGDKPPVFSVKIDVMPLGKNFELKEGESFELDDKTWVVKKIDIHKLTLVVDGKRELEFRQDDFLSEPQSEIELETVEPAEVSTVTD